MSGPSVLFDLSCLEGCSSNSSSNYVACEMRDDDDDNDNVDNDFKEGEEDLLSYHGFLKVSLGFDHLQTHRLNVSAQLICLIY